MHLVSGYDKMIEHAPLVAQANWRVMAWPSTKAN
jgi:hypothetical protein